MTLYDLKAQILDRTGDLESAMARGDNSVWPRWRPEPLDGEALLAAWRDAMATRGTPGSPRGLNVYLHVPYCQSSCRFCMYWHGVDRKEQTHRRFVDYLVDRLDEYRAVVGPQRATHAYWGGGTPSLLPAPDLERLLDAFTRAFSIDGAWTVEANPLSTTEQKIDLLAAAGVRRISMGVQAFDPGLLKAIGRLNGPPERTRGLIARARSHGIEVNADLMVGLPSQSEELLMEEVRTGLWLGADSLTVYRYQPTLRLPGDEEPVRLTVLKRTRGLALRRGYVPMVASSDEAFGAAYLRAGFVPRFVRDAVVTRARGPMEYSCFEDVDAHLVGFGPGAYSHLFGHAWYREVTDLGALDAGPEWIGSRLDATDELRSRILSARAQGQRIRRGALMRLTGVDPADLRDEDLLPTMATPASEPVLEALDTLLEDGRLMGRTIRYFTTDGAVIQVGPSSDPPVRLVVRPGDDGQTEIVLADRTPAPSREERAWVQELRDRLASA